MKRQRTMLRLAATVAIGVCTLGLDAVWSQGPRPGERLSTSWLDGREVVDGEVLVRYRSNADGAIERRRAEFQSQTDEVEVIGRRGMRRMRSRRLGTRAMLQALRHNPDVEFAEPNYVIRVAATPNDPSFGALWGLFNTGQTVNGSTGTTGADISAPQAWDVTTGSAANVVGVIDTGIDYLHADLAANIWTAPRAFSVTVGGIVINCAAGTHGFNAITNTCDPMDDHYHGTHVAGTIGAVGNNGIGVAGVNWVASMMGLKFLGSNGSGSTANAIKAIEFAIQAKAVLGSAANVRVLSNSWGGGGYSQALKNQIDAAAAAEMLFVAAAGNNAQNTDAVPNYPSSYPSANVISVAASTNRDQRASFSNYGVNSVHLGAPGQTVVSTMPNNGYASLSGTSMATPHVSGAAALVLAACPMTTTALKAAILGSVDPIASMSGVTVTGGRLDVNAAVRTCTPPSLLVNGGSSAVTVAGGSAVTVTVVNGPGFRSDFVLMVPAGSPPQTWGTHQYLNGTKTRPDNALTSASLTFTTPASGGAFEFRFYQNDTWTLLATSAVVTVTAAPASPSLKINGSTGPVTVAGGSTITVAVNNGPGLRSDFVLMVPAGSPAQTWGTYLYLSGTTTRPVVPLTSASLQFAAPASGGSFEFRFYQNDTWTLLATSAVVTVTSAAATSPTLRINGVAGPVTATGGSPLTVTVSNGPGYVSDFVVMVPAGSPPQTWGTHRYLSGTTTRPATPLTSASLQFTAPAAGGSFEFRFYQNDTWTLLASSAVVTVAAATPALKINGVDGPVVVPAGSMISVAISNGPGAQSDYVLMVPAGSPAGTWGEYKYLNDSRTRPGSGLQSATVHFVAPAAGGTFEFRFYYNDSWALLATSSQVSVTPP